MDISIIIPSYNTKDLLDRCLTSVYESIDSSGISVEVIVVDNASTDGSIALLKTKYPRVKKILNKSNVGYGKANNQAIKQAKGTYILLLNSDIQVIGSAIPDLYTYILGHDRVFIGGKLLNEDRSPQASCGPMYHLPVVFAMLFLRADTFHITRQSPDHEARVDWVSGACIIAKKESFEDTGLFDEGIFMYMEEIDLLYRAKKKGYTILFYPDAVFIHSGAASSGSRRTPVINIYRGLYYFYRKHKSSSEQLMLMMMLKAKAYIAIMIGTVMGDKDLRATYENALELV